jgi:hypothetical protein
MLARSTRLPGEARPVGEKIGRDQLVLRSHGTNDDVVAVSSYAFEFQP